MKNIIKIAHHMDDYVCMWNGVEDIYIRDTGETLPPKFFFVLSSFGGFCYMKTPKSELKRMVALGDGRTRKMYEFLSPIVGFDYKTFEYKTFEKALTKIKSEIDAGYPCMIGALDMFYLPHFEKIYHKEHIPFHYELAIGYDDETQTLYFNDCGRTEIQEISYDEFRLAFDCSYPGLSKPNTVWTIRMHTNKGKYEIAKEALTKKKEEFEPLEKNKVKMYVCGPTVYNLIHIGNARPMICFDTVRRYLEYKGYEVNYVSNFTDVDDKIIKKANEEGVSAEEISTRYIAECKKDMEGMNIKPATTHPLATQEIGGMIDMIQTLIDKGYAYNVNGTVYYRTRKFEGYGKLSKKNIDDLEAGHRDIKVAGEDEKEDPLDFVLWKPKKEGEPSWPSPWSDGRPGWHIECSVMAKKYLADEIDIHAGGEDLIFPHHENEIAQSEAANGVQFAKYWMHNAFLNIDNKKMSKSLGNFFTVRDISKEYDLQVLRFFMLSAHYRNPINFSHDLMESAKNGLERIVTAVANLKHLSENAKEGSMAADEAEKIASLKEMYDKFEQAMDDDFNTADAISAVFEIVKFANSNSSAENTKEYIDTLIKKITTLTDVLGLKVEKKEEILDEDIEKLIAERQQARKDRNFARADEIRDELLAKGIVLEDTREGVRWKRA